MRFGRNLRLSVLTTDSQPAMQFSCQPAPNGSNLLLPGSRDIELPVSHPDGKCNLPAVNPGRFSCRGFFVGRCRKSVTGHPGRQ